MTFESSLIKSGQKVLRNASAGLLVLSLLFSCSTSDSPEASNLAKGCTVNSDCSGSLKCLFQRCHAACAASVDCPSGQHCVQATSTVSVCQLTVEEKCTRNSDCGDMLICAIDLVCRNQCEAPRDCLRGQQCVSHTCADPDELEGGQLAQLNDAGVELRGASSSDASAPPNDGGGDSTTGSGGGTADAGPDVSSGAGGSSGGSADVNLPEASSDGGSDETTIPEAEASAEPTCTDGMHNGTELGIDCGGTCTACPVVIATSPLEGATNVAISTAIAITFNVPLVPATLTAQTSSGACSGSVQMSSDDFATCIGFQDAAPAMSVGNTVATLTPSPALSYASTYRVKVTASAQDAKTNGVAAYASATGFTTESAPPACAASPVLISQVYGAGGNLGASYTHDFIELHNVGTTVVDLTGWSVQYAGAAGVTWLVTPLSGDVQPGSYVLVQEAMGSGNGVPLPSASVVGTIPMSALAGKVALVNNTTALTGVCPLGAPVVDLVGYGATTTCFEGNGVATGPINATSAVLRSVSGCVDTNSNDADFIVGSVVPHNFADTLSCVCTAN